MDDASSILLQILFPLHLSSIVEFVKVVDVLLWIGNSKTSANDLNLNKD